MSVEQSPCPSWTTIGNRRPHRAIKGKCDVSGSPAHREGGHRASDEADRSDPDRTKRNDSLTHRTNRYPTAPDKFISAFPSRSVQVYRSVQGTHFVPDRSPAQSIDRKPIRHACPLKFRMASGIPPPSVPQAMATPPDTATPMAQALPLAGKPIVFPRRPQP